MEYVAVCAVALIASGLTLFSGFGLGTLLLPAFALFFPLTAAVAMTAVVHLLNNFFKLLLLGQYADKDAVVRFGVPAILTSFVGALVLVRLSGLDPIATYQLAGRTCTVTTIGLVIAVLMIVFAFAESVPRFGGAASGKAHLVIGGAVSGFFGGLSGHQGALRSAFLVKYGLSKEAFIASGVAISCLVDVVRIGVYSAKYDLLSIGGNLPVVAAAVISAFAGAAIANRLLKKISMRAVRIVVTVMLVGIALGLGMGVI